MPVAISLLDRERTSRYLFFIEYRLYSSPNFATSTITSSLLFLLFRNRSVFFRFSLRKRNDVIEKALQTAQMIQRSLLTISMPLSFLTATYGVFGTSHGGVTPSTCSSAGHPYPIICPAEGHDAEYVYGKGTLIGMFDDLVFDERTISLKKGDRIFLYTDGIPETTNEKRDLSGYDNLPGLVGRCNGKTLESTLDSIMEEINHFKGSAQLGDDIVLLGFEVIC
jgi:serine phosphatase RsbU (regulator of sigma subunit)